MHTLPAKKNLPKKVVAIVLLFALLAGITYYAFAKRSEPIMGALPYLAFIVLGLAYVLTPHKYTPNS